MNTDKTERIETERVMKQLAIALELVWNDKNARFGMDKITNTPIAEIIRKALSDYRKLDL